MNSKILILATTFIVVQATGAMEDDSYRCRNDEEIARQLERELNGENSLHQQVIDKSYHFKPQQPGRKINLKEELSKVDINYEKGMSHKDGEYLLDFKKEVDMKPVKRKLQFSEDDLSFVESNSEALCQSELTISNNQHEFGELVTKQDNNSPDISEAMYEVSIWILNEYFKNDHDLISLQKILEGAEKNSSIHNVRQKIIEHLQSELYNYSIFITPKQADKIIETYFQRK